MGVSDDVPVPDQHRPLPHPSRLCSQLILWPQISISLLPVTTWFNAALFIPHTILTPAKPRSQFKISFQCPRTTPHPHPLVCSFFYLVRDAHFPSGVWQPAPLQLSGQPSRKCRWDSIHGPRRHRPSQADTTAFRHSRFASLPTLSGQTERRPPACRAQERTRPARHKTPHVQGSCDFISESAALNTAFTDLLISEGFVY